MSGKHIENKACPKCSTTGKGKSLSVYEDGEYCNECHYTSNAVDNKFHVGEIREIQSRKLGVESLGKYRVQVVNFTGHINKDSYVCEEPVIIFNFYDKGRISKQKIRSLSDKRKCTQLGDTKSRALFGQQAFTPSKKIPIVVTEGEFDAVAVHQAMNYPAVSMGACTNAKNYLAENLEWLSGWAYVILCFDSDEAGTRAVDEAIPLFEIGKVRVAHMPLKDANDMVMAGRDEELKRCIWNAEIIKPSTIVSSVDIMQRITTQSHRGIKWVFPSLDKFTYGMQPGTMYTLAAAEGVGKTAFIQELVFGLIEQDVRVGLFSFEQRPESTFQRLIGSRIGKNLHLPDGEWWDEEIIRAEADKLKDSIYLYDNKGALSLESVLLNIRYLVKCYDVKFIVIDNLTALSSTPDTQGKYTSELNYLIQCAGAFSSLCNELGICLLLVGHLNNDTISKSTYVGGKAKKEDSLLGDVNTLSRPGLDWEAGRVPTMSNIYMGGALRKLSDVVLVLSRNRVSEEESIRTKTIVKCLKNRIDSSYDGKTFDLVYDMNLGRLKERAQGEVIEPKRVAYSVI